MIVRAPRPESRFYVLSKSISENPRLSWAARGLLVYLLGKPDNWQVSPTALVNETGNSGAPMGRDGVYGLLAQLRDAGYLRKEQLRNEDGTLGKVRYIVSEVARPLPALPDTDRPDTAQPLPAKTTQTRTEEKARTEDKQALRLALGLAEVPQEVFDDWHAYRVKKKAPVTKLVITGLRREAGVAGVSIADAMATVVQMGWSGFRADYVAVRGASQAGETNHHRAAREFAESNAGSLAVVVARKPPPHTPPPMAGTVIDVDVKEIKHGD